MNEMEKDKVWGYPAAVGCGMIFGGIGGGIGYMAHSLLGLNDGIDLIGFVGAFGGIVTAVFMNNVFRKNV